MAQKHIFFFLKSLTMAKCCFLTTGKCSILAAGYFLITEFESMHQSIFNTEIYNSVLLIIFQNIKVPFISTLLIYHTALYSILKGSLKDELNMQIVYFPKYGLNVF